MAGDGCQRQRNSGVVLKNFGGQLLHYTIQDVLSCSIKEGSPLVDSTWFENGLWVRLHPSLLMHGTVGYNVQLVQQVKALAIVRVRISDEDWVHSITPHMMLHVVILNQGTVGFAYDGRRLENL